MNIDEPYFKENIIPKLSEDEKIFWAKVMEKARLEGGEINLLHFIVEGINLSREKVDK